MKLRQTFGSIALEGYAHGDALLYLYEVTRSIVDGL